MGNDPEGGAMSRPALATLFCSVLLAGTGLSADVPSKVVDRTLPLAADGRLVLETYKGRVDVTTWDRPEAAIHAVVTPDGTCDDAAELVLKTEVRIDGGGREVRIVSDYDDLPKVRFDFRGDCASRPFVKYEVRMPKSASLELKDHKSRIRVDGLAGDLSVDSYKGTVRLTHVSGKLDLETYKGGALVELDRVVPDLRAETYKGEIDLVLPKGEKVDLHEEIGRRGRLEAEIGTAPGTPRVSVETYKGTIRLRTK
jgi:hypothetical protein